MLRTSPTLRTLSAMTLANTVGSGLLATSMVLYFTHLVGLSGTQVGVGLTVAGGLGLLVGIPVGHVADRLGPREVMVVLLLGQAVATVSYVFVHSFGVFLLAVCLVVTVNQAATGWGLAFGLAPEHAQGQYQGAASTAGRSPGWPAPR